MGLASTLQDDWSGGAYRGRKSPANAGYDLTNFLINDEGQPYKRGGSAYYSASDIAAGTDITQLHTVYMSGPGAYRVLARRAANINTFDGSKTPFSLGSATTAWSRPASVSDFAIFATGTRQLTFYGGTLKAPYSTGTLTVTAGSTAVTGSGTSWLANTDAGAILAVGSTYAVVQSVDSDTAITLTAPWPGVTAAGTAYSLNRTVAYSASALAAGGPGRSFVIAAGAGTPRLLFCIGNHVFIGARGDANVTAWDANLYHQLPSNVSIIGAEGMGETALIFTTAGVWRIDNLSLDPVDDFGNQQQTVAQVNRDVILWDDYGLAGWAGNLVIPAIDDVYVAGQDFSLTPITGGRGSQYDGGIRSQYRAYVAAGYRPGIASTYQGHYILPILNGTTWVDTLVSRLDHGAAWSRWTGGAGSAAYAVLPGSASAAPILVGLSGRRVTNLTGCFAPTSSNTTDADLTTPTVQITTRDYPTGGQHGGFVVKARARYELTPAGLDTYWTADPWNLSNGALTFPSGVIAGSVSSSASRSWINTGTQTGSLLAQTILATRPSVNTDSLVYSALGFVQTPHTGTASGYEVRFRYEAAGDTVAIYRYDNGALTRILDPVALPARLVSGDLLEAQVSLGSVYAVVNGVDVASVASTDYFNAGQPAYFMEGIVDIVTAGTRSAIRHTVIARVVTLEYSSDQDDGVFTALTTRGEEGGATGWTASDGSRYQWATVGRRRERIRFRLTLTTAVASFVLRSFEVLTRPSGRQ